MKKSKIKEASLYSVLQNGLEKNGSKSRHELEETAVKQALLERPSFSVKVRLTLIFLLFFLISAGASVTVMVMLSGIDYGIQFVTLTDGFANEIQHARRSEKNYFLYGSDLAEVLQHLTIGEELLEQTSQELGHVVGTQEIDSIHQHLKEYRLALNQLIEKGRDPEFRKSEEFKTISETLRDHGSRMLGLSLDISRKERQMISSTTQKAERVQIFLMVVLLLFSIFIASHIYRHIILRLTRLLEATRRFASGDLSPMTPQRKYKDEFSHLVIAMNHMMYELEKRQDLLLESQKLRAIGNLTAGVAHELNNPLNNIILTSEVLKQGYRDLTDEELEDIANDLVTQGERAQRVVKNLLDFARESETKTEYFQIEQLVDETLQLARNQIKISRIELIEEIEENLPPIYGDRELLKQVLLNLFINAIDAMPKGGVLSVKVSEEKRTGFLSIQVSDTGHGIPSHILGSIFSPFFTTKATGKGTGLGLAVSRGIIEKHGGDIEVESKVNEGAKFTVHLPIVPIPAEIKADQH